MPLTAMLAPARRSKFPVTLKLRRNERADEFAVCVSIPPGITVSAPKAICWFVSCWSFAPRWIVTEPFVLSAAESRNVGAKFPAASPSASVLKEIAGEPAATLTTASWSMITSSAAVGTWGGNQFAAACQSASSAPVQETVAANAGRPAIANIRKNRPRSLGLIFKLESGFDTLNADSMPPKPGVVQSLAGAGKSPSRKTEILGIFNVS